MNSVEISVETFKQFVMEEGHDIPDSIDFEVVVSNALEKKFLKRFRDFNEKKKEVLKNLLYEFVQNQPCRDMIDFTVFDKELDHDGIDYENVFLRLHTDEVMKILESRDLGKRSGYFRSNEKMCNQFIIEALDAFQTEINDIYLLIIGEFYTKGLIP